VKIGDYNTAFLPLEVIDMLNDIQTVLNFGKYQRAVVTDPPTWVGRQGEEVYVAANTWALYVCTSDQSTRWALAGTFAP
jgi:hypothetical protein